MNEHIKFESNFKAKAKWKVVCIVVLAYDIQGRLIAQYTQMTLTRRHMLANFNRRASWRFHSLQVGKKLSAA